MEGGLQTPWTHPLDIRAILWVLLIVWRIQWRWFKPLYNILRRLFLRRSQIIYYKLLYKLGQYKHNKNEILTLMILLNLEHMGEFEDCFKMAVYYYVMNDTILSFLYNILYCMLYCVITVTIVVGFNPVLNACSNSTFLFEAITILRHLIYHASLNKLIGLVLCFTVIILELSLLLFFF